MDKKDIYLHWYNIGAGVELLPDVNGNPLAYTGENDTLFYAEVIMMLDMLGQFEHSDAVEIELLMQKIAVFDRPGRYHRDLDSARKYKLNREGTSLDVNPISKDNVIAIMYLLKVSKNEPRRLAMAKALFTSLGTFNNTDKFRMPVNPGTYTTYGFLLPGILPKILGLICLPIFLINLFISAFRDNMSNHMLNLIELYGNKEYMFFNLLLKGYKKVIKHRYGSYAAVSAKYYSAPIEHPITTMIKEVGF